MTHRVSTIDDHRRTVPGRGSGPVGGGISAPPASRRAAARPPARTAPTVGRAHTVPGPVAAAPGCALATCR
ncbi:hypothetical protein GA0070610_2231 [Micromonospora echinofusca]|uniref:Uncharacterized protein n=1 Tax=Micromonospora echinofusca TaxID=47858 RepID=A0A1C5G7W8_MICEH|nr:hypothetical protein GA0070610_2231 [Micromonospora echinofusca]